MENLERIFENIKAERAYQDEKWGTIEEHPHTMLEWVLIAEKELKKGLDSWLNGDPDWEFQAKCAFRKAMAVCCAAQEQHGTVTRELEMDSNLEVCCLSN
jgi:hypothetical protein